VSEGTFYVLAKKDFEKARTREMFARVLSLIKNEKAELLSFQEVKGLVKPTAESYAGMRTVPVALVVGSEGRYHDFNRSFLPRHQHLRRRWERVDVAHYQQLNLPPVQLYELGGVYFVRDGNHRLSVARSQGVEFIDAEVITLQSRIKLKPDLTRQELKRAVIELEKREFCRQTKLAKLRPGVELEFTATGRYDEIIRHINGHKYYLNLGKEEEISFQEGLLSWYDTVYLPIIRIIKAESILDYFPGRTAADLYVWIVKHWDELKRNYGLSFPLQKAAEDFTVRYGQPASNPLKRSWLWLKDILRRLRKRF